VRVRTGCHNRRGSMVRQPRGSHGSRKHTHGRSNAPRQPPDVTPDYAVELRRGVLEEIDGPMLVLGLQEFQTSRMLLIVVTARS
jgi:hypothetical protein